MFRTPLMHSESRDSARARSRYPDGHEFHQGFTIVHFLARDFNTSCTCPFTLTPRQANAMVPLPSMTNVLRTIPLTDLPKSFFSFMTPYFSQTVPSGSLNRGKGSFSFFLNFWWEEILSRLTPRIWARLDLNAAISSRKSPASRAHPGVLSFG